MKTQSKSRILFLDVDGVLNSHKTGGRYPLKKNCLRRLQRIVEETSCEIVLSSTWRLDEYAFKRLCTVLSYRGIRILDKTIRIPSGPRGLEIAEWLHRNPTEKYAILDDDSDMLDNQLKHFFQTDGDYGLTDTITYRVIFHLTND